MSRIKIGVITFFLLLSITSWAQDLDNKVAQFRNLWPNMVEMTFGTTTLLIDQKMIKPEYLNVSVSSIMSKNDKNIYFAEYFSGKFKQEIGIAKFGPTPFNYMIGQPVSIQLEGKIFCLPGNGYLYVVKVLPTKTYRIEYTVKYSFDVTGLIEYKQDLISVNLPSHVNSDFTLFGDQSLTRKIADIANGSEVTIVAIDSTIGNDVIENGKILIRSQSGILGWMINKYLKTDNMERIQTLELLNTSDEDSS